MAGKWTVFLGALAVALGLGGGAAQALTTTWSSALIGHSQTVDFACSSATVLNGGSCGTAASSSTLPAGRAVFTLDSVVGNMWTFDLGLSNTGTNDGRLVALGFDSNPALSISFDSASSGSWGATTGGGGGALKTDFCIIDASDPKNCSGGNSGGLSGGGATNIKFSVSTADGATPISFDFFDAKFQSVPSICGKSVEIAGISAVPVPASLPLLLSGFGILGFAARRRRGAAKTVAP